MSGQERRSWPAARPRVRRRQTLPSLPATGTDEDQSKQQQQQQQQRDSWKKHSRVPSSSSAVPEPHDPGQTSATRSRRLGARLSGDGQTAAHAPTSASGFADTRGPHRRLGRTPSSPSVLLSKVKERIREKVSTLPQRCKICICATFYILRFKHLYYVNDLFMAAI